MSDAKHTPEPWVGGNSTNTGAHELIGDGRQLVALVYGRTKDEQDANLALLKAAPALLVAAIRAKDLLKPEVTKESDRTIFWELVGAIAKATGAA